MVAEQLAAAATTIAAFETGSLIVTQALFNLVSLLFHTSECWDHRHVPPHLLITRLVNKDSLPLADPQATDPVAR